MSALRIVAALLAAVLLQLLGTSLLPTFPLIFDLPLLVVVLLGLTANPWLGLLGGLAAGLASDAVSGGLLGLHGFSDTLIGYAIALLAARVMLRQTGAVVLVGSIAAAVKQALFGLFGVAMYNPPVAPEPLWALANISTTALLCLLVQVIRQRFAGDPEQATARRRLRLE